MYIDDNHYEELAEWSAYKDFARYVDRDGIVKALDQLWSYVNSPREEHLINQFVKHYEQNKKDLLRTPHTAQEQLDGICEDPLTL